MICKICGSEFDEEMFDVCPFCLSPIQDNEKMSENLDNSGEDSLQTSAEDSKFSVVENCETMEKISDESDSTTYEEPKTLTKEVPYIVLREFDDLSVRAKNVFAKNNIETFEDLMEFLKSNRVTDLRGAGVGVEEEVSNIISRILCEDYESIVKLHNCKNDGCVEDKVIEAIQNGELANIGLDSIYGMSTRSYNFCYKNEALDMLSIAKLLKVGDERELNGFGKKSRFEFDDIFGRFLDGEYSIKSDGINKTLVLENALNDLKNTRDFEIFLRRSKGETLQEVGDTPTWPGLEPITRERVRQIEAKFLKKNKQLISDVVAENWGDLNYFAAQEIRDLYGDDDYGTVIISILKNVTDYLYLDYADIFVKRASYGNVEDLIENIISEFVGDGVNLYDKVEEIDDLFRVKGIDFMGLGEMIAYMQESGYRFYGDYVTQGRTSYATLCAKIIKEKFPSGIKLNQDNENPNDDLQRLRELVLETYGDIGVPNQDRSLSARLLDTMIICDRGKVIPEECVQIDLSLIEDIKVYIDKCDSDKVYYAEIFANFEGILSMTSNVNNHYFLHGVLMKFLPDEYDYHRDFLVRKNTELIVDNVADRIKKYISETGRPVTRKELKNKFPGFTDIMISLQFSENADLVQREYNLYSIMDFYSYNDIDINKLFDIISNSLNNHNGVSSERLIYDDVKLEMENFLARNNMTMPIHLYYFCAKKLNNFFDFRHPNISRIGMFEMLSMNNIACYLLGDPEILSSNDFYSVGRELKWPDISISNAFYKVVDNYYRISEDEYIKRELFEVSNETVQNVSGVLYEELSNSEYMSLIGLTDFNNFEEMEYEWNSFVLESIIQKYIPEFKIISQENRDKRYHRSFIVKADSNISSYSDLVARVFKRNGYTSLSEGKFLSFLVVNGLANVVIPKEILTSGYFKFEKEFYILNN
ncbi:MAG: hypothetical protein Q4C49_12360 [Bacillota bacterium]|nr:hypothetical protein [Bacillota bacterium]